MGSVFHVWVGVWAGFTGAWKSSNDADAVFAKFFGADNPFSDVFSDYQSYGSATPFNPNLRVTKKVPTVTNTVFCSLEEMYSGCIKRLTIQRKRFTADGVLQEESKTLVVDVKPGYKTGTKITFPNEGDEDRGLAAGDVVFVLDEKPHPYFTRAGNELQWEARVPLVEALTGATVQLTTLDGRLLSIPIPEIIVPGYQKLIPGEGMPSSKNPQLRGDLRLKFQIAFPRTLQPTQKQAVSRALAGCPHFVGTTHVPTLTETVFAKKGAEVRPHTAAQ